MARVHWGARNAAPGVERNSELGDKGDGPEPPPTRRRHEERNEPDENAERKRGEVDVRHWSSPRHVTDGARVEREQHEPHADERDRETPASLVDRIGTVRRQRG